MSRSPGSRRKAALAVSRRSVRIGTIALLLTALAVALAPLDAGSQENWVFQGRVFRGEVGDKANALPGVTVSVYASNDASALGKLIRAKKTNETGGFQLKAPRGYEFYTIVETNLPGYVSAGAEADGGDVLDHDRVAFRGPLRPGDLGGIRFWDRRLVVFIPMETRVLAPATLADASLSHFTAETPMEVVAVRADRLDTVAVSPGAVTLEADELYRVARTGDSAKRVESPAAAEWGHRPVDVLAIPEKYVTRVEEDGAATSEAVTVQPIFWPVGRMRYDEQTGQFHGSLLILLEDQPHSAVSRDLAAPIEMMVTGVESVSPERVSLSHTNFPPDTVRLAERSPVDSVRVTIHTTTNPRGYDAALGVKPALIITPGERSMQGWGVQSIEINVGILGASPTEPVGVSMVTSLGSLDPGTVSVAGGQFETVKLRSEGLGHATVTASAAGFTDARGEYDYDFPLRFILFALVGGLVGALIAYMRRRQRGETRSLQVHLVGGILWGVVVALAYGVVGVNLLRFAVPGGQPFSEGLVFVISALGALCWIPAPKSEAADDAGGD